MKYAVTNVPGKDGRQIQGQTDGHLSRGLPIAHAELGEAEGLSNSRIRDAFFKRDLVRTHKRRRNFRFPGSRDASMS